jgi:hypothetical protein
LPPGETRWGLDLAFERQILHIISICLRNTFALKKSDVPRSPTPSPQGGGDRGPGLFLVIKYCCTPIAIGVVAYLQSAEVLPFFIILSRPLYSSSSSSSSGRGVIGRKAVVVKRTGSSSGKPTSRMIRTP